MRDAYLNDVGDDVKYALLRALAGSGNDAHPTLGVLWYLTAHEEVGNDGRHRTYLDDPAWSGLDPRLFSAMRHVEDVIADRRARRTGRLAGARAPGGDDLPGARLYDRPLDDVTGPPATVRLQRCAARAAWWGDAARAVASCDIVFADPDNGVRPPGVRDGDKNEPKYSRRSEIVDLLTRHELVVVYQHANRASWSILRTGIVDAVRADLEALGERRAASTAVHTLAAATHGRRGFLCFARTDGAALAARHAMDRLVARAAGTPLAGKLARETDS